jgi:hypothetical protein
MLGNVDGGINRITVFFLVVTPSRDTIVRVRLLPIPSLATIS